MEKNSLHREPSRKIKRMLKQAGISITQFGYDMGTTPTQASLIANGFITPADSDRRAFIADYLDTTEADLWPGLKGGK